MDWSPRSVVLGDEIRISVHNFGQLLGVPESHRTIKSDGRVLWNRRISEIEYKYDIRGQSMQVKPIIYASNSAKQLADHREGSVCAPVRAS